MARLLFVVLVLTLVSGCKLKIVVPEGGTVETSSGNYSCAEGETCVLDIKTTDFDELFLGVPKEGYIFVSWRLRERALCGRRRDGCPLATTGFGALPGLLDLLASDEEFYLEAQFQPTESDDGPITDADAGGCFGAEQMSPGSRLETVYTSNQDTTEVEDFFVVGAATFDGMSVIQSIFEFETSPLGDRGTLNTYFTVDDALMRIVTVGTGSVMPDGNTGGQRYTPGLLTRFDLESGESFNQVSTAEFLQDVPAVPGFTSVSEIDRTVTYVGRQQITVPAGTFETCRFETVTITNALDQVFESRDTTWLGVGTGVLIRFRNEGYRKELESGTLNGSPL